MDIIQFLNAVFDISANISVDLNATLPITLAILGVFHLHKKISERRTKDKTAHLQVSTNDNSAHLQIHTKERAARPKLETVDKLTTNH